MHSHLPPRRQADEGDEKRPPRAKNKPHRVTLRHARWPAGNRITVVSRQKDPNPPRDAPRSPSGGQKAISARRRAARPPASNRRGGLVSSSVGLSGTEKRKGPARVGTADLSGSPGQRRSGRRGGRYGKPRCFYGGAFPLVSPEGRGVRGLSPKAGGKGRRRGRRLCV